MENRTLEIHTFYICESSARKTTLENHDIYGKDLFEELALKFPNYVNEFPVNKLKDKTTKIPLDVQGKSCFKISKSKRIIYGKINIGDDNKKEQDVVSANKKKDFLYTKKIGHSVERPFFYMLILPKNRKAGFLILEREGRHAMKKDFGKIFSSFVKDNLSGLYVDYKNFLSQDIVKHWLTIGKYKEIVFNRKSLPNDIASAYLADYQNDSEYDARLSLMPKKGSDFSLFSKNKIIERIESHNGFFERPEFDALGFDEKAEVKVVLDFNGRVRTVDISDTNKVRPYYSVQVKIDANGFSNLESIKQEAFSLMASFDLKII